MSASPPQSVHDEEESLSPEGEADILRRAAEAERTLQQGKGVSWDALFPSPPVVLDEDEEEEMARRLDDMPELDRQALLAPVGDFLADVRREIRQRRAG
jgi:hypothetical protein